jgi:hypothetical protein
MGYQEPITNNQKPKTSEKTRPQQIQEGQRNARRIQEDKMENRSFLLID